MELPRKFDFFPIFHYKTILFSSESQFSMKNVFFWGISCWCSSKIKKVEGGLISSNCSLWLPLPISLFFELHQHDVLQKNTFFNDFSTFFISLCFFDSSNSVWWWYPHRKGKLVVPRKFKLRNCHWRLIHKPTPFTIKPDWTSCPDKLRCRP